MSYDDGYGRNDRQRERVKERVNNYNSEPSYWNRSAYAPMRERYRPLSCRCGPNCTCGCRCHG